MVPATGNSPPALTKPWRTAIAGAAALAFIVKFVIALKTYGTNDAYAYELFGAWSRYFGVSVYHYWSWNDPPFTLHMVRAFAWAARASNLPFPFWLRLTGALADAGSVWLVCRMLGPRLGERHIALAAVFFALSPTAILISGFHGNTDAAMVLFILLAIFCAQCAGAPRASGAALAIAMGFKVVPLIFIPVFLFCFDDMRKRAWFLAALCGTLLLTWSPYIFEEPGTIIGSVFGYKSLSGLWGISYLLSRATQVIPEYAVLASAYQRFGVAALFTLLAVVSILLNPSALRRDLFAQAGIVLLLFMTFTNGFGVQYLAWLCPFVVALGASAAGAYFAASGVFLFAVYNYWAQGLPWYLADSNRVGPWHGFPEILQLLCWLSVVVTTGIACRRMRAPASIPGRAMRTALYTPAALAGIVTICSLSVQSPFRQHWSGSDAAAMTAIRVNNFVALSTALSRDRRYPEAISADGEALKLNRNLPGVYNNIAEAHEDLRQWDEAIRNAREAIRLDPGFMLARINLAWSLEQKRLAGLRP